MQVRQRIEAKLRAKLAPALLDVLDESSQHAVPTGAETHFKVVVVSHAFNAVPLVARHRLVYEALAEELGSGVHALAIIAKTPAEWEASADVAPSPPCLGGSSADATRARRPGGA